GDDRQEPDPHEPQGQRGHHGLAPRPLELAGERLRPLDHGGGPFLQPRGNPVCELHVLPSSGPASELYRRRFGVAEGGLGQVAGPSVRPLAERLVKAFTSIEDTISRSPEVCNPPTTTQVNIRVREGA